MKFKTLVSAIVVAGLVVASLVSLPVLAQKEGKGATAHTKEMNEALYGQLPFFDKTDFRNAHKGFMKWFTEFGHLNRGDMLTSEQHRCHNEKKKFQRRV
ncbi:hydrolase [Enterobacter hormaechei]|uniref:Hydrolase n=1 Tax=Enterobacter hormaechei TaxID=158836 RepID=A0AAX3Z0M6_9ENTR|nr:hydrolase [Enterobacter hormaechei]WMB10445.1 hydrolase [Enterobacter hormaechei]